MQDRDIESLIDERKIRNVIVRHCQGGDRHDAAMMAACYWPEARIDHGMMAPLGVAEFVAQRSTGAIMEKLIQNFNFLGQIAYDIDGPQARVESYIISYHRIVNDPAAIEMILGKDYADRNQAAGDEGHDFLVGGRYLDIFEKRGDEWRILTRVATAEWELSGASSKVMIEGLFKTAHGPKAGYLE